MKILPLLLLISAGFSLGCSRHTESAGDASVPASYPLKTCVISGEKLGGMGKPFAVTHEGTEVLLCCKSCLKDFNADPGKYVKIVTDAAAKK